MQSKYVVIYYFSGTGNTTLIANKIYDTFLVYQYNAVLRNMAKIDAVDLPKECVLGLIFPVAIQSTFPLVWDFVDKLPYGNGREVFMADTMESFSGGIVGPLKKILTQKGYKCIGAKEFKMSTSMQIKKKQKFEGEINDQRAIVASEQYVRELIEGKTKWYRIPFFSDLMRQLSIGSKVWRDMSEKIEIDQDKCILCNQCVHFCPKQSLDIKDKRLYLDHDLCISCMRCVNYCPRNAFTLNGKKVIQKRVIQISNI